jgi:hypothetical protein
MYIRDSVFARTGMNRENINQSLKIVLCTSGLHSKSKRYTSESEYDSLNCQPKLPRESKVMAKTVLKAALSMKMRDSVFARTGMHRENINQSLKIFLYFRGALKTQKMRIEK